MNTKIKDYIICLTVVLFACTFSFIASTSKIYGIPILLVFVIISFFIHWVIFLPSYIFKTEKYYDITGTIAYLIIFLITIYVTKMMNIDNTIYIRSKIILFFITIWAIRLGLFLLIRVFRVGEDRRFNHVKNSFSKFLFYFTISGLWVFLTTCNAITMILNNSQLSNDIYLKFGIGLWILGFIIEVLADEQKRRFRNNIENKNQFISSGLWKISRHPNYFGEILQWVSIGIVSLPVIYGIQYITLISPIFVIILLTNVSGINILEKNSDEKWGLDEGYLDYKNKTPKLIPFINFFK